MTDADAEKLNDQNLAKLFPSDHYRESFEKWFDSLQLAYLVDRKILAAAAWMESLKQYDAII